ncbi:calmodulin-binding protein 60 D-like [Eucalyptus grandis]|uniref:calmodulin-binding protein 60 D-like n=1 Tax=Eucalyptus grandis TaxID=71139 RepID=UPI00192E932E|nr:calmodulin-binding protein 60 D-like [Eucalyptus grandis]
MPSLAFSVIEALKVDSLHKLCSSLEPILRRVGIQKKGAALWLLGLACTQLLWRCVRNLPFLRHNGLEPLENSVV